MSNRKTQYEVGYKKPPRSTQFQPGQSPNAKGRPKGSKTLQTEFQQELKRRVSVRESGKHKKMSMQRVIATRTINSAAAGDHRSTALILKTVGADESEVSLRSAQDDVFGGAIEEPVMENIIRRILAMNQPAPATDAAPVVPAESPSPLVSNPSSESSK